VSFSYQKDIRKNVFNLYYYTLFNGFLAQSSQNESIGLRGDPVLPHDNNSETTQWISMKFGIGWGGGGVNIKVAD
jgi:hypothetical protein